MSKDKITIIEPMRDKRNERVVAAVDIGSNAARILIKSVTKEGSELKFKKLQFLRIPVRLGMDVFKDGKIGMQREAVLLRTMKIFRQLLILYNVDSYRICATSAFREAKNGKKVLSLIRKETKLKIDVITGMEEARILRDNNYAMMGNLLYVDVGGGSTELSFVREGELIESRSFDIGTLRILNNTVNPDLWQQMADTVNEITQGVDNVQIIGTGGNINKLYRLAPKQERKNNMLKVSLLGNLFKKMSTMSVEERMLRYNLRESRADVIVPAAQIFLMIAEITGSEDVMVPTEGLADGIIKELAERQM